MSKKLFSVILGCAAWIGLGMVSSADWTVTAPSANHVFEETATILSAGGKETNYMVSVYLQREVAAGTWVTQDSELDSDAMDTTWGVEFEPNPEWEVQGADRIRMCSVDAVAEVTRIDHPIVIQ
jgi:hypothetical protein